MDFDTQAKAIWAALDEMAAKNPGGYKEFINDQLNGEGATEMLKQLKLGQEVLPGKSAAPPNRGDKKEKKPSRTATTAGAATSTSTTTAAGRLPSAPGPSTTRTTSSGTTRADLDGCLGSSSEGRVAGENKLISTATTSLLDDSFPQQSNIPKSIPLITQFLADEDGEEETLLTDLQLPGQGSGDSGRNKGFKPLIEEI